MAALALEIKHGVDHVLQDARAGDEPVLGHVADQHDGEAAPLRQADQLLRRGPHLAHGPRRAVELIEIHGLDRIDDDEVGRVGAVERSCDVADAGRGGKHHRSALDAEPLGPEPYLVERLFARDIGAAERPSRAPLGQRRRDLQQQRRFADARVAAHEKRRAWHQSAAAHAVELGDAGEAPRQPLMRGIEALERELATRAAQALRHDARRFLGERVPRAAGIALAAPFRMRGATLLADIPGFGARHRHPRAQSARTSILIGPSARPWMNWSTKGLPECSSSAATPSQMILPRIDHGDAIGDLARRGHVVRDRDRGGAEIVHALDDEFVDHVGHDRVEPGGGLVEDDDLGFGGDGARQCHAFLHPARKLGRAQRRPPRAQGRHCRASGWRCPWRAGAPCRGPE